MKTPEQLMQPRYKVVAEDTSGRLMVGSIITLDKMLPDNALAHLGIEKIPDTQPYGEYNGKCWYAEELDKYPHLFQPLQWWEDRQPEDMPEYVKDKENDQLMYKVYEWYWGNSYFQFEPETGLITPTIYFIPATLAEYQQYQSSCSPSPLT